MWSGTQELRRWPVLGKQRHERHTQRDTRRRLDGQEDGQTDRQTGVRTARKTERQTNRHADRLTEQRRGRQQIGHGMELVFVTGGARAPPATDKQTDRQVDA